MTIIDCVSDLHGFEPELEGGDLLIVAGDLTARDKPMEYDCFCTWLMNQPYKKKIFIGGNHDNLLTDFMPKIYRCPVRKDFKTNENLEHFEYLCDSGTEFEGLKIWGSPWTPWFYGVNPSCKAFMLSESKLVKKWELIPTDTDILITHGPPYGILDRTIREKCAGSTSLYAWLKYVVRPKLHVFGHIHENYGKIEVFPTYNDKMMISVNASHVNEKYEPVNKPIRIIL